MSAFATRRTSVASGVSGTTVRVRAARKAGSIAVATGLAVALTDVLGGDEGKPRWVGIVQALLGLALVVYGLAQIVPARRGDPPPEFLAALDDMAPGAAARLGLVLVAANPKALLLS